MKIKHTRYRVIIEPLETRYRSERLITPLEAKTPGKIVGRVLSAPTHIYLPSKMMIALPKGGVTEWGKALRYPDSRRHGCTVELWYKEGDVVAVAGHEKIHTTDDGTQFMSVRFHQVGCVIEGWEEGKSTLQFADQDLPPLPEVGEQDDPAFDEEFNKQLASMRGPE